MLTKHASLIQAKSRHFSSEWSQYFAPLRGSNQSGVDLIKLFGVKLLTLS